MSTATILFIAFGLAMDAFAVSVASGIASKNLRIISAFKIAALFGSFQAGMTIIGWSAGLALNYLISGIDHWMAFGLLSFIGCRMIFESRKAGSREIKPLVLWTLLVLSIATSIDALAVGISFPFVEIQITTAASIIGLVTFVLSFAGVYLGNRIGHLFENFIEALGGLILIVIGVRILVSHIF